MPTLAEIRAQYPQYNDMSDGQFADAFHRKFYSDMPRDEFNAKIGLGGQSMQDRFATAFDPSNDSQQTQGALDAKTQGPIALADVGGEAIKNLVPSAKQFGNDMLNLVLHPIETGKNIANVGIGAAEKLIPGQQSHEVYANAVGQYFADRYGGLDNLKKTMAKDPVGFLADASTILSGGSMLAARAPGIAGTVARVAGTAGKIADPINVAMKAAGATAKGVGKVAGAITGTTTGAGGKALGIAGKAGFSGGAAAKTFRENMRGASDMADSVEAAKQAIQSIKSEREAAYKAGMADLSNDRTVLDFNKIDQAFANQRKTGTFTGPSSGVTVSLEPSVAKTAGDIAEVLDEWRNLPPNDFHTPEGLDALKQRIGDIRDSTEKGSRSEKMATQVYNTIKSQITAQAPTYAKTMDSYRKMSETISEVEREFSLGRKGNVGAALRKLQSAMRDNVNTSYGNRVKLVELMQQHGATHLMEALAGQAVKTLEPRGIARQVSAAIASGGVPAALALLNPKMLVGLVGGLALSSPRIMGEAAYLGGRVAKGVSKIPTKPALRAGYETRSAGQPLELTVSPHYRKLPDGWVEPVR